MVCVYAAARLFTRLRAANYLQQVALHDLSGQRHCSVLKHASPPPDALGATPRVPGGSGIAGTLGLVSGGAFSGAGTDGTDIDGVVGTCGVLTCAKACVASAQETIRIRARSADM